MDTDHLLDRIARGEPSAAATLFAKYRRQLRTMIALRISPRLTSRIDPSDVVQEALAEAHRRLPDYVTARPIPFYPWLRRIAWERLLQMHRQHIAAARRTVLREDPLPLSDESKLLLAERLATASSPSGQMLRQEVELRVREAIAALSPADREIVVLKHLEELRFQDIAVILEMPLAAVYSRYYRAVERLHRILNEEQS